MQTGGFKQELVLKTWGRGRHGVLGHGDGGDVELPRQVENLAGVIAIACGELHCMALTDGGCVLSWGSDMLGALGHGGAGACRTPAEVIALRPSHPIIQISAGRHHSLVRSAAGGIFSWGTLYSSARSEPLPQRQAGLEGRVLQIGCGDSFCAALTDVGVFVWGMPQMEVPHLLCAGNGMHSLSCGGSMLAWVGSQGEAYITPPFLDRGNGRMGRPQAAAALLAPCGKAFVHVGSGAAFSAGLTAEGRVYVFTHAIGPLALHGVRGVEAFLGSPAHIIAIDADGRLLNLSGAVQVCRDGVQVFTFSQPGMVQGEVCRVT